MQDGLSVVSEARVAGEDLQGRHKQRKNKEERMKSVLEGLCCSLHCSRYCLLDLYRYPYMLSTDPMYALSFSREGCFCMLGLWGLCQGVQLIPQLLASALSLKGQGGLRGWGGGRNKPAGRPDWIVLFMSSAVCKCCCKADKCFDTSIDVKCLLKM